MLYSAPDARAREDFHQGRSHDAYRWLGAHKTAPEGKEWKFTVWAPNAQQVYVTGEFCHWHYEDHPMEKQFDGTWELTLPAELFAGDVRSRMYKYAIRCADGSWHLRADPYGFSAELRPGTASLVCDLDGYNWHDAAWMAARKGKDWAHSPMNIYEMHLGSWKRHSDGSFYTYEETADELIPYLLDMRYTHVEFLPVMEHPLDMSWGYQVTGFFAPTARYGTAAQLMRLIDRLHQAGIAVILDWVPAHFPRNEEGLRQFDGTPCYEHADPRRSDMGQWGTVLFDYGRGEVCSFLISSACYWLRVFHADGLRCDAVSAILYLDFSREPGQWLPNVYGGNENLEGAAFLKRLNETAYAQCPGVIMIAEESTAYPRVTHPVDRGGLGFGFKWNMGWMNDMLSYIREDPINRKYQHNKLTFSLMYAFSENYILPFSHDEVVHGKHSMLEKQPGDLWRKFAGLRALLGYQLAHPGKKLNFMGTEFGHFIEWKDDGALDWFLLVYQRHPDLQRCVRAMNKLYQDTPALWQIDDGWDGFTWLNPNDNERSITSFVRWDKAGNGVVCVTNFIPAYYADYVIGLPEYGFIKEILNTDRAEYGGSDKGNEGTLRARRKPMGECKWSCSIVVPPLATVFFEYRRPLHRKRSEE